MKIHYIYIKEYKNIKDFELYLDHNISLFIWKNGSGKSNLLEAITKVFVDLYKWWNPSFTYKIRYQIEDRFFEIEWVEKAKVRPYDKEFQWKSRVNVIKCNNDFSYIESILNLYDKKVINNSFLNIDDAARNILPTQIITSYTWWSIRLRKLWWWMDKTRRNFIYYQFKDYQKILLTLFSYNIERYQDILKWLWMSEFIEANIKTSDKRFIAILEQITEHNLERINNKKPECTIKWVDQLNKIREYFWNEKDFFDYLKYDLSINITDIKIKLTNWLEISDIDLSEWQKHKIWIIGLIEFLQWYENLFLFDEPDNFFHPNWQRELIGEIESLIAPSWGLWLAPISVESLWWWNYDIKSHVFIVTHSPLLLWSSDQLDIYWLHFNDKSWKEAIICSTNKQLNWWKEIDVYGNRAEFIYKEVFGLDSTKSPEYQENIKNLEKLINKKINNQDDFSEENIVQINTLKEKVKQSVWEDLSDPDRWYISVTEYLFSQDKNESIKK